jgi:hypothetical protein
VFLRNISSPFSRLKIVIWAVRYFLLADKYHRLGETYCFCLQPWRWWQYVSPKRWYLPTSPQYFTTQKTKIDIHRAGMCYRTDTDNLLLNSVFEDHCLVSRIFLFLLTKCPPPLLNEKSEKILTEDESNTLIHTSVTKPIIFNRIISFMIVYKIPSV